MDHTNPIWRVLYGTVAGRMLMKLLLCAGMPQWMAGFLRCPLSRPLISRYARRHHITLDEYERKNYRTFAEFFARRREHIAVDETGSHLISPCDGLLSAFPVAPDSTFAIKGSRYSLSDLLEDRELAERYSGGLCLIVRLTPSDYHRYIFVDDGYSHESHFIEGKLHSVKPIACEKYPVYRLNRRCWTLLETEHFGGVAQIEVGALAVGGIVNRRQNARFRRGEEKGHFELCGSTIVLLLERGVVRLLPEIETGLSSGGELRVRLGDCIATKQ